MKSTGRWKCLINADAAARTVTILSYIGNLNVCMTKYIARLDLFVTDPFEEYHKTAILSKAISSKMSEKLSRIARLEGKLRIAKRMQSFSV